MFLYMSSLAGQDGLHFGVQRFALGTAASDRAEASDAQSLSCFLDCVRPLLQGTRSEGLLTTSRGTLGHNFAPLVLKQICAGKSSNCFLLAASQHCSLRSSPLRNLADFFTFFMALIAGFVAFIA